MSGAEALATLAENAKAGTLEVKLREPIAGLSAGDVVVAVITGGSVRLRAVRTRPQVEPAVIMNVVDAGLSALTTDVESTLTAEDARVLAAGGFDVSPLRADETSPTLQAAAEYRRLLDSSLTVPQAARRLGVNTSRVRQRLLGDPPTLYGIKDGTRWRVPTFQFAGKRTIPSLGTVLAALPKDLHPVAVHRWLTCVHQDLYADTAEQRAVSPLDWLRMGRSADVVAALAREL